MRLNPLCRTFLILLFPLSVYSQEITFSDFLGSYTGDNARGYTQPLTDALAASMNSGLNHRIKAKRLGFEMYIDFIGTFAFIPSSSRSFTAIPEGDFEPKTPTEVPTIVGDAENVILINEDNGTGYVFPAGYNVGSIPLVYPQLTIGSVFGTQFVFRYFYSNITDVGTLKYSNYGLNHNIKHWIPGKLPVDLAVGFHYHNYTATDSLKGKGFIITAKTSYDISIFTFYGGLAYESSSAKYEYINTEGGVSDPVSFESNASNNIRFTVGFLMHAGPFNLFADYSIAKQSVLSFGFGFAINEGRKAEVSSYLDE